MSNSALPSSTHEPRAGAGEEAASSDALAEDVDRRRAPLVDVEPDVGVAGHAGRCTSPTPCSIRVRDRAVEVG